MSNTFQQIQDRSKLEILRVRACIILSEELFLRPSQVNDPKNFPNWLEVVLPRVRSAAQDDTAGQLSEVRDQVLQQRHAFHSRMDKLEREVAQLSSVTTELKSQSDQLTQDMREVLNLLQTLTQPRGAGKPVVQHHL